MGGVGRHAGNLAVMINGVWAFLGICLCCSPPGVCANDQQLETGDLSPVPSPCQLLFAFCCPPAQSISPPLLHDLSQFAFPADPLTFGWTLGETLLEISPHVEFVLGR